MHNNTNIALGFVSKFGTEPAASVSVMSQAGGRRNMSHILSPDQRSSRRCREYMATGGLLGQSLVLLLLWGCGCTDKELEQYNACNRDCLRQETNCRDQCAADRDDCKAICVEEFPDYMSCYWDCRIRHRQNAERTASCLENCADEWDSEGSAVRCVADCDDPYPQCAEDCDDGYWSCEEECWSEP